MRKYSWILLLAIAVSGCGPKYLERSGIPLIWGMRMDETADEFEFSENLAYVAESDANEILLELPLRADSFGLPVVGHIPSKESMRLLKDSKRTLSLVFATTNYKELFPTEDFPAPQIWFRYLNAALDSALAPFMGCEVSRVILAADWGLMTDENEWRQILDHIRTKMPDALISFGARHEALHSKSLSVLSDEIAIDYAPIAGEELKSPCRTENLRITALAKQSGKPIFIFRANVIGENPALQIQNRLRFWQPEVEINGICLNTLYAKIPPRDATTYYGMADDPAVSDFIRVYKQRLPL